MIHAFENLAQQRKLQEGTERSSSSSTGIKDSIYKINLPPTVPKPIVRHKIKGKAPEIPKNTVTTQTSKYSTDENESIFNSLNIEDNNKKFPQSYVKNHKSPAPLIPERKPSKIPTKQKPVEQFRTNVFLKKPKTFSEDDIENDFLRGTTISQSFVSRKSPKFRKVSTYEQNFLLNNDTNQNFDLKNKLERVTKNQKTSSLKSNLKEPLIDEVSRRYKEYNGKNIAEKDKNLRTKFHLDHAEL